MKKKIILKVGIGLIAIVTVVCLALKLVYNRIVVNNSKDVFIEVDSVYDNENIITEIETPTDFFRSINTVVVHDERDTIIGNFTGKGLDTLYVVCDTTKGDGDKWQYYAKSNNKAIPKLNMWGYHSIQPKLVNEGDLDGNGTCDVGYLHTWINSQWRTYRVFSLINGHWCYLINPSHEYMETGELIRGSSKEIVEPYKKGWVKVNYQTQGVGATFKDTIVKPDYSPIDD